MKSKDIRIRAISQEMPQPSITKICLEITCLKFHSNFPGANELKSAALALPLTLELVHPTIYQCNTMNPKQIARHFADNILRSIFFNENGCILIWISLQFVPECPIHKSVSVQVMAWCQRGDKLLLGPIMTQFTDAYIDSPGSMCYKIGWKHCGRST